MKWEEIKKEINKMDSLQLDILSEFCRDLSTYKQLEKKLKITKEGIK